MGADLVGGKIKLVVAAVALIAIAGGSWWVLRPAPVAEGVVFVGDSVTYLSLDDLTGDLGPKHPAYIARVGFRSIDLVPLLTEEVDRRTAAGEPLRQAALLVGYNDALQDQAESPGLEQLMMLADRFDCALWLTLPPIPDHEREVERWNARVRAAIGSHPHIHLVDTWREAVMTAPAGELLSSDGIHPNAAGRRRLTEIYLEAIGASC